jgi:hypothetical protein
LEIKKPPADSERRRKSSVSGRGGEKAITHTNLAEGREAPSAIGKAMPKHRKSRKPSDADLHRNPLIGGSKGTTRAGVSPEDLAASEGANTFEDDLENDTNPQGGIEPRDNRRPNRGAGK